MHSRLFKYPYPSLQLRWSGKTEMPSSTLAGCDRPIASQEICHGTHHTPSVSSCTPQCQILTPCKEMAADYCQLASLDLDNPKSLMRRFLSFSSGCLLRRMGSVQYLDKVNGPPIPGTPPTCRSILSTVEPGVDRGGLAGRITSAHYTLYSFQSGYRLPF